VFFTYISTSIITKKESICIKKAPLKGAPQPFGGQLPQTALPGSATAWSCGPWINPVMCIWPGSVAWLHTSDLANCIHTVGVEVGKILGVRKNFARILPNFPEKDLQKSSSCQFRRHVTFKKSCVNSGAIIFKSKHVGRHFCSDFQGVLEGSQSFVRISEDFARMLLYFPLIFTKSKLLPYTSDCIPTYFSPWLNRKLRYGPRVGLLTNQNRRQKVFNRGLYVCARGLEFEKW